MVVTLLSSVFLMLNVIPILKEFKEQPTGF